MKHKNGFTLVELLAVIMLLGLLIVFVVPNIVKLFKNSNDTLSVFQIKELKSSVEIYINDTCLNPVNVDYICDFETTLDAQGNIIIQNGVITLEEFFSKGYFELTTSFDNCVGNIIISNNEVDLTGISCS